MNGVEDEKAGQKGGGVERGVKRGGSNGGQKRGQKGVPDSFVRVLSMMLVRGSQKRVARSSI